MNNLDQGWLTSECQIIDGIHSALLMLLEPGTNKLKKVAEWPGDSKSHIAELIPITKLACNQKKEVVNTEVAGSKADSNLYDYLAFPLIKQGKLHGIISLKITSRADLERSEIIERFNKYLNKQEQINHDCHSIKNNLETTSTPNDFYTSVVKLASAALELKTYEASSQVMISELASTLECERVSIGILKNKHIRVTSISNSASFDPRSNLVRDIANAMEEAIDQDSIISYCKGQQPGAFIDKAHADLSAHHDAISICTIPLIHNGEIYGAVILERSIDKVFDKTDLGLCEQFCSLMGPYLALMRSNESSLLDKTIKSTKTTVTKLFGFNNLRKKILATTCLFLIVYISIAEGDIQIKAPSVIEGLVQRMVAAPMDGYVSASTLRAGDIVKEGDVLAVLDDKDLELEHLKLTSNKQKLQREYRKAMANHERVQMRILSSQLEQTNADISLVDEQLARTQITSPFDGIIIDGDLSQALNSPVSRGEVLFKIAPLDGYRIILNVDEKNILHIDVGQTGLLALVSFPGETFPIVIEKITPVAQAENGGNSFRVEASLELTQQLLRPGMRGVGRVQAGKATYFWIWTHELLDWLRLWVWSWRP